MVSFVIDTVKVGDTVEIQYDPKDPSGTAFTQGLIFGCIAITVGGILVPLIVGTILTKKTEGFYRIFTKEKNLDLLFVTFYGICPQRSNRRIGRQSKNNVQFNIIIE